MEAGGLDRPAEDVDEEQHEQDRLHREADEQVRLARDAQEAALREDERVRDPVAKRGHRASTSADSSVSCSAAWPVRFRKTSSSVGVLTAISSIAIPASSRRRTASAIVPRRSVTGTRTVPSSRNGRSLAIEARAETA